MSDATGYDASPAACAPDDVLAEILLRLPPHPASLSRASLVCTRWRRLARDPGFLRRFRAFHGAPPVLGFFHNSPHLPRFVPTGGPPGRIAAAAASLRRDRDDGMWWFVDCRHGLALLRSRDWADLLAWDPITAESRRLAVPIQIQAGAFDLNAAVVVSAAPSGGGRDVGDYHPIPPFRVVVVAFTSHGRASTCVYSSPDGAWGELVSTPAPSPRGDILHEEPGALVGDALYWLLNGSHILEFEFLAQNLSLVQRPSEMNTAYKRNIRAVKLEDDRLGLAAVKDFSLHLWARQDGDDGVPEWVLHREIELDSLLSLPIAPKLCLGVIPVWISGIGEDGNAVFLRTTVGIFLVWLETMKFKKVSDTSLVKTVYPYASFCVPDGQ